MSDKLPRTTRSLPIALIRAREGVMAPIREMLADSGITEQQWRVLRVLQENGALDATTLADRASLLVPSLTRISRSLQAKGLVTQTPFEADRRRQIIEITDAGADIIARNTARALEIVEGFKEKLGEDDYELLLDLLARLRPRGDESTS